MQGGTHADSTEMFIYDTNKCTFYIYTNTILYRAYMFRHHAILMQLYTTIYNVVKIYYKSDSHYITVFLP